jgi:hypothetical protein
MRDYMDGHIDTAEYVRRIKLDTDRTIRLIEENRELVRRVHERQEGQRRQAEFAGRAIRRALRLLRRLA